MRPQLAEAWAADDAAPNRLAGEIVPNSEIPMYLVNGWRLAIDFGDAWLMTPPAPAPSEVAA